MPPIAQPDVLTLVQQVGERKKVAAKDTAGVMRKACRITHWKLHSAEGFYCLQTCSCFEGIGLLYNVKHLRDKRRVRQNTTLYYDVMCHRTDNSPATLLSTQATIV